ncbi:MAG: C25 family cysteine peptidase, partial [Thermoguttaceae bacterium]
LPMDEETPAPRDGGPVAVVAGSRVTMPYGMSVLATELVDQCFQRQVPTLGDALLAAKQRMGAQPDAVGPERAMLDAIAGALSPAAERVADERAEHVLLMNLLGDPMLRLRYPQPVELHAPEQAPPGGQLRVEGTSPIDGEGKVELVVTRGRLAFTPPPRRTFPTTSDGLSALQAVYEQANDGRLAVVPLVTRAGRFAVELPVPSSAAGPCHVRVYLAGDRVHAAGSRAITIARAEEPPRPPYTARR